MKLYLVNMKNLYTWNAKGYESGIYLVNFYNEEVTFFKNKFIKINLFSKDEGKKMYPSNSVKRYIEVKFYIYKIQLYNIFNI